MVRNNWNGSKKMMDNVDTHAKIYLTTYAKCCDGNHGSLSHQATHSPKDLQNKERLQGGGAIILQMNKPCAMIHRFIKFKENKW